MLVKGDGVIGKGQLRVEGIKPLKLTAAMLVFEESKDLVSVAKGKRDGLFFSAQLGAQSGFTPYGEPGPYAELALGSPAMRVEMSNWRIFTLLGAHQNKLKYRGVSGTSKTLHPGIGVYGSYLAHSWVKGMQLHLYAARGWAFTWRKWDEEHEKIRDLGVVAPSLMVGTGISFITEFGLHWGLNYRRDWTFPRDEDDDEPVLNGANVFGLVVYF